MKIGFIFFIIFSGLTSIFGQSFLGLYDFSEKEVFSLPADLKEISGLTLNSEGRIFTHNDEKGVVYEIDFDNRKISKSFSIGWKTVYRDFEGIVAVNEKFFLMVSNGDLYEFNEKPDKRYSDYKIYNSVFSAKFDFEGFCYDPIDQTLLLAAKEYPGKDYDGMKTVFEFDLKTKKFLPEPKFQISLKELETNFEISNFSPSGIEYNPRSQTFYALSSNQKCLIEIDRRGKVLDAAILKSKYHSQPEGITFDRDGNLLIADEGRNKKGTITRYRLKETGKSIKLNHKIGN